MESLLSNLDMQSIIWLYVLAAFVAIIVLYYIKELARVQVWIRKRVKLGSSYADLGYLKMDNDGSAGEVHLPGGGSLPAVGRVVIDKQAGRELGFVDVVTTDIQDETQTAKYKQIGYITFNPDDVIDKYGYIYRQERGKRKKELVGYCARPSDPDTPTLYGERTWRSLWLRCTLNVYAGRPTPQETEEPSNKGVNSLVSKTMYIAKEVKNKANKKQSEGETPSDNDSQISAEEVMTPQVDAVETPNVEQRDVAAPAESATAPVESATEPTPATTEMAETISEPTAEPKEESNSTEATNEPESAAATTESSEKANEKETKSKKEKKAKNKQKSEKEPLASASYVGFHISRNDILPAEARACAFAALSGNFNRGSNSEFFKSKPYGWIDTALLTSVVYTCLFFVIYFVYNVILERPLLGDDGIAFIVLTASYYLLWALVRLVKIDCIENSNSFQKRLDLFNKNLGVKGFNIATLVIGLIAIIFCLAEEVLDFVPLIWAIVFGVFMNMTMKGANSKWLISTSFQENDNSEIEDNEVINPPGDIARTYEWELDSTYSTQQLKGSLTLYFTSQEIADIRQTNPFFAQRKDKSDKEYIHEMFQYLTEHRHFLARIKYIARCINDTIKSNSLTPIDKIQFTLDFIQEPNIRFVENRESRAINNYEYYIRYPDEILYDKEGDSNSKSLLAAALFHTMGYNVMYLASRKHNHSAVGIEIDPRYMAYGWYGSNINDMVIVENGKSYLYCETTGDRFRIGKPIGGMNLNDFDEKVILESESGAPADISNEKSVIYNWDLDSHSGAALHGNLTLKFDIEQIEHLREINPFMTYGYDDNTYDSNICSMAQMLNNDSNLTQNVEAIAQYIKQSAAVAKLSSLDTAQFALNFAQTPNIGYCIDEECESIGFKTEYMRFPDETLFDKEGDCDCKSFLLARIFHSMGYNTLYLLSKKLKHAALAIEFDPEWSQYIEVNNESFIDYNGRQYIYCESTGSGNKIGNIREGDNIGDFDTIIELRA